MFGTEPLTLELVAYIFSVAFQVAGAVLLIIKYWGKTEERIIDEYFPGSNFADRDENNMTKLECYKVRKCVRKIYDNRMSFVYIAIGYILAIFGSPAEACKICVLSLVVACTIILILFEKALSYALSILFYRKDIEKDYDEIQDKADTVATETEIEEVMQELFGDNK